MRILVVEDEKALADVVVHGLEEDHYFVDLACDGKEGFEQALERPYNMIILDIMLPSMDGFQICQELRNRHVTTPILMLTARDRVVDRVRGLETGADDYLPKPFAFTELRARVRALLRRDKVHKSPVIRVADLVIDTASHSVARAGKQISLTRKEYELLEALATNEGRVLTRDAVRERIWLDETGYSNTVDVRIAVLRRKIDSGHQQKLIHTIYGVGYVLKVENQGARL